MGPVPDQGRQSPHRIRVRSVLQSRDGLRAQSRALWAEGQRLRDPSAAVAQSRDAWRRRARASAAARRDEHAGCADPGAPAPAPSTASPAAPTASPAAASTRPADLEGVEERGR